MSGARGSVTGAIRGGRESGDPALATGSIGSPPGGIAAGAKSASCGEAGATRLAPAAASASGAATPVCALFDGEGAMGGVSTSPPTIDCFSTPAGGLSVAGEAALPPPCSGADVTGTGITSGVSGGGMAAAGGGAGGEEPRAGPGTPSPRNSRVEGTSVPCAWDMGSTGSVLPAFSAIGGVPGKPVNTWLLPVSTRAPNPPWLPDACPCPVTRLILGGSAEGADWSTRAACSGGVSAIGGAGLAATFESGGTGVGWVAGAGWLAGLGKGPGGKPGAPSPKGPRKSQAPPGPGKAVAAPTATVATVDAAGEAAAAALAEAGFHLDAEGAADGGADASAVPGIPAHVVTEDGCQFWLPLECSVEAFKFVLSSLPSQQLHSYVRYIEWGAMLLTSRGNVTTAEGYRTVIRSLVRKLMLGDDSQDLPESDYADEDVRHEIRVVVDMDRVLQVVMEILLLRQNTIEQELRRLYVEGDDNGDGVLSFEEFSNIVTKVAPHYSERRVLRMFREALTSGSESSFAIEKSTFCSVCKAHGLVQLIDIRKLEEIQAHNSELADYYIPR